MPEDSEVASPLFCRSMELLLVEGYPHEKTLFDGAFQVIHQCRLLPNTTAVALLSHPFTSLTCHLLQQSRVLYGST
jgi:hypothetical protein